MRQPGNGAYALARRFDDTLELAAILGRRYANVTLDRGRTYVARSVAVAQGVTLTIPAGTIVEFTDNGLNRSHGLTLDDVTAVTIQGDGTIRGTSTTRTSSYGLIQGTDSTFLVDGLTLHTSPGTGVWTWGGSPLVRNLHVYDTGADGVHISRGATNFEVSGCNIHDNGDDGIGVTTYTGYARCDNGLLTNNVIDSSGLLTDPLGAGRGIALGAATNVEISDYTISNSNQAGIIITCAPGDTSLRCSTIEIGEGTINTTGLNVPDGGVDDGIYVTYTDTCTVTGATISNTPGDGIRFVDTTSTALTESGNSFSGIGGSNVNRI